MYYTKGDTPAAPLLVVPARDNDPVDLELYTSATAQLVQPDGTLDVLDADIVEATDDEDAHVAISLPMLEQAGIVQLGLALTAPGGKLDTFELPPVAVQEVDGWHTIGSARGEADWAKHLEDWRLFVLLAVSKRDCLAYMPHPERRPGIPEREAQLLHAKNRSASAGIDPATGDDGVGAYSAGPFPLDWVVKALLRPVQRARLGGIR